MSDRELVLELCNRLGLEKSAKPYTNDKSYLETDDQIRLGCGDGYCDFECIFEFDGDKLTGHRVVE